jgi:MraZ protein
MGFRGTYTTRMDDKGRLKVPARFKHQLDSDYTESIYFITSLDGTAAHIYPIAEWEKLEERVKRLDQNDPLRNKWLRATSYYGQEVEIDGQGRLLLPTRLREKANLKDDVDVVGMAEYMEVMNHEALSRQVEGDPFTVADAAALSKADR